MFTYPYGDFNTQVQAMVQATGYSAAFAAGPGNDEDNLHLFALPRVMVSYYDTPDTLPVKPAIIVGPKGTSFGFLCLSRRQLPSRR